MKIHPHLVSLNQRQAHIQTCLYPVNNRWIEPSLQLKFCFFFNNSFHSDVPLKVDEKNCCCFRFIATLSKCSQKCLPLAKLCYCLSQCSCVKLVAMLKQTKQCCIAQCLHFCGESIFGWLFFCSFCKLS